MAAPAPVTVAFQNSYEATTGTLGGEGNAATNATKTLTGRAAAAGEFSFPVRDAQGNVVATATNQAPATARPAGLRSRPLPTYRRSSGWWRTASPQGRRRLLGHSYTVSEDGGTDRLSAGDGDRLELRYHGQGTDNGKGGLDVAVVHPLLTARAVV